MARVLTVGERALLVEADDPPAAARWIRSAAAEHGIGIVDVVPAARTVLVTVPSSWPGSGSPGSAAVPAAFRSSAAAGQSALRRLLGQLPTDLDPAPAAELPVVEIPVRFDGPDLDDVAQRVGSSADRVCRHMLEAPLVAAFCGFAPGFTYLTGIPQSLRLPRRPDPRTRVPAGSLALADGYAAIYPRESPGGWHLLGTTDAVLFDVDRDPPALIQPGTRVRLVAE